MKHCLRKEAYRTEEVANRVAKKRGGLRVYKCNECPFFHITSRLTHQL